MGEIEEILREKMNDKYGSVRSFAKITEIPYDRVIYGLNKTIDSINFGSIKKISDVLDINLNLLAEGRVIHNYEVNDDDIKELIELYINLDKEEKYEMKMQLKYLELKHNKKNRLDK